jgi:protein kinase A
MDSFKATKVKLQDYDVMQTLGTGSFGRVRLAKHKSSGDFVALKMLKKAEILRLKQVDHIISENTILSNINHPFLVSLIYFLILLHLRLKCRVLLKMKDTFILF